MTVEHRLSFDITDILAVTLECKKCHGRFVQQPGETLTLAERCPICGVEWFAKPTAMTNRVPSAILDLVDSIRKLRSPDNKQLKEAGFIVRLEFEDPRP